MGNSVSSKTGRKDDSLTKNKSTVGSLGQDNKNNNSKDCLSQVISLSQNDAKSKEKDVILIGEHENQISAEGEPGLHTHFTNCKKNPGHRNFIPIKSFSLEHLPDGYRDIDLYELIKATADLTVWLSVTLTSPDRPEFWPNTKVPYFLYELCGKNTFRTGTGRVTELKKFTENHKLSSSRLCQCNKCRGSSTSSKIWWKIYIATAANLVFDCNEAKYTTLRLFYDSEHCEVVILKDTIFVDSVKFEEDWCMLTYITCDENLASKLTKMKINLHDVWWKVRSKYKDSRDRDRLSFIVSHTHGCSKMVSIGHWLDKYQVGSSKDNLKFTYTTCTCPGSSGATVHCLGFYGGLYTGLVHGGSLKTELNYSGVGQAW